MFLPWGGVVVAACISVVGSLTQQILCAENGNEIHESGYC